MQVNILFQHGWAMDHSTFTGWAPHLAVVANLMKQSGYRVRYALLDQGYFGPRTTLDYQSNKLEGKLILVGHSLGLHLLPESLRRQADYLLCISSFANFHKTAAKGERLSRTSLRRMLAKLETEPSQVLFDFWKACGLHQVPQTFLKSNRTMNVEKLIEDLRLLDGVDIGSDFVSEKTYVSVINGNEDALLSSLHGHELSLILNASKFHEVENGQHALPITHPQICAAELARILENIANLDRTDLTRTDLNGKELYRSELNQIERSGSIND